jgi:hypothetical protein
MLCLQQQHRNMYTQSVTHCSSARVHITHHMYRIALDENAFKLLYAAVCCLVCDALLLLAATTANAEILLHQCTHHTVWEKTLSEQHNAQHAVKQCFKQPQQCIVSNTLVLCGYVFAATFEPNPTSVCAQQPVSGNTVLL